MIGAMSRVSVPRQPFPNHDSYQLMVTLNVRLTVAFVASVIASSSSRS